MKGSPVDRWYAKNGMTKENWMYDHNYFNKFQYDQRNDYHN